MTVEAEPADPLEIVLQIADRFAGISTAAASVLALFAILFSVRQSRSTQRGLIAERYIDAQIDLHFQLLSTVTRHRLDSERQLYARALLEVIDGELPVTSRRLETETGIKDRFEFEPAAQPGPIDQWKLRDGRGTLSTLMRDEITASIRSFATLTHRESFKRMKAARG